jgi:hypothetical protein
MKARIVECEAGRQRHDERRLHHRMRAEAARAAERRDRVTDLQVRHAGADGFDHASVFGARHERQRRLHLVLVLHDQQVREVQARSADRDTHFILLRLGRGQLFPAQRLDADRVLAKPGMHGMSPVKVRVGLNLGCSARS